MTPTTIPGSRVALALCLTLATPAVADEVRTGMASRLTADGMAFSASLAEGLSFDLPSVPIYFTVDELGCEYDLYIYGYQGDVELGDFFLETVEGSPDHLALSGNVSWFEVGNIIIEATSPDWWCPNYNEEDHDVIVSSLSAHGASFVLRADGGVVGDALILDVLDHSSVHLGDLQVTTTQWYLPDELIEASVESFEDEIEQLILDEAAVLLGALLFDLPSVGVLADFQYEVRIDTIEVDGLGLSAELNAAADFVGEVGECGGGSPQIDDDEGEPGAIQGTAGDMQLVITEELADAILGSAWAGGLLCAEFQHLDFSDAAPLFPALQNEDGVRFAFEVDSQPSLSIVEGEVHVVLPEVRLELEDTAGGEPLFRAIIAVTADVSLSLDRDRHVLQASLLWADLEFIQLDASGLLHGTNYTEQAFLDLIDDQVLLLLPDQLAELPLAPLSFGITGLNAPAVAGLPEAIGAELIELELRDGVAQIALDGLLDVDDTAPWVEILTDLDQPLTSTRVSVEYAGEDDREGQLTYSWRLDDGAWSFWSPETVATFVMVDEGLHTFEVRARDVFWNEGSPVEEAFQLTLDGSAGGGGDEDGCGCDAGPSVRPLSTAALAALLGGLVLRRRTRRT